MWCGSLTLKIASSLAPLLSITRYPHFTLLFQRYYITLIHLQHVSDSVPSRWSGLWDAILVPLRLEGNFQTMYRIGAQPGSRSARKRINCSALQRFGYIPHWKAWEGHLTFPSFSLHDVLGDRIDLIWRYETPSEAMSSCTVFIDGLLAKFFFRGFSQL